MALELVATDDGSLSIRDAETGELHHNRAGAYAEALVNYVQPSGVLLDAGNIEARTDLYVLDSCFGLGYNSLVLLSELAALDQTRFDAIHIIGIEQDQQVLQLIPEALKHSAFAPLRDHLDPACITAFGATSFALGDTAVSIELVRGSIRAEIPRLSNELLAAGDLTIQAVGGRAPGWDLVFHDPFSAKHVPELWTIEFFQCYHRLLAGRCGKLLTYSVAAAVRGGMRSAGFHVFRSTALGGKSGGTVGCVNAGPSSQPNPYIFPLTIEQSAKLDSASGIPYRDPTFAASGADIKAQRLAEQTDWSAVQTVK